MTQSSAVAREPSLGHHSEPSHHSYDLCSGDLPAIQEEPVWGLSSYLLIQCVSLWQLSSTMDSVHPAVSFVSLQGEMSLPKSRAVSHPLPWSSQSLTASDLNCLWQGVRSHTPILQAYLRKLFLQAWTVTMPVC